LIHLAGWVLNLIRSRGWVAECFASVEVGAVWSGWALLASVAINTPLKAVFDFKT